MQHDANSRQVLTRPNGGTIFNGLGNVGGLKNVLRKLTVTHDLLAGERHKQEKQRAFQSGRGLSQKRSQPKDQRRLPPTAG